MTGLRVVRVFAGIVLAAPCTVAYLLCEIPHGVREDTRNYPHYPQLLVRSLTVASRGGACGRYRARIGGADGMTRADHYRALMAEAGALARDLRNAPAFAASIKVLAEMNKLSCDARTRGGHPCRRTDLADNGRCRFHGGASTGPKTQAGKDRARANLSLRWRNRNDKENT